MKKIIFIIAIVFIGLQPIWAQDIKTMFDEEQYQGIIDTYANRPRTLSVEELMYVSQSYMFLNDTQNGLKYADLAAQKDKDNAMVYFVKGVLYNNEGNYKEAISNLDQAIRIRPQQANYYTALGDSYYGLEDFDSALSNYQKAISTTPPSERAYFMIGTIYASQGNEKEALKAFYQGKSNVKSDKELYVTILYNIGKMEYDGGSYEKAANVYKDLLNHFPDDYYSYEKLVQCYNGLDQIGKANLQKTKLYAAYKKGLLESSSISDRFCFDQFKAGTKDIVAYERYEEFSLIPMVKRLFYVLDENGNIESTILQNCISRDSYSFVMTKNGVEYVYRDELSGKNPKYTSLKAYISDIVTGKIKPENQN